MEFFGSCLDTPLVIFFRKLAGTLRLTGLTRAFSFLALLATGERSWVGQNSTICLRDRHGMQVVERGERDMEQLGAAPGVVARQRGDRRLHLRRRLGHDVEGVPGAHGWECSTVLVRRHRRRTPVIYSRLQWSQSG